MPKQLLIEPNIPLMAMHFTSADERTWTCSEVEEWLASVGLQKQHDGQWIGSSADIRCLVDSTEIGRMRPAFDSSQMPHLLLN